MQRGSDAIAVNISAAKCDQLAALALSAMNNPDAAWLAHRAEAPAGVSELGPAERANLLLVGNAIEGAIHRHLGPKPESWKDFYDKLVEISLAAGHPMRPESLIHVATGSGSVYEVLRANSGADAHLFPNSPAIAQIVTDSVQLVVARYKGDASGLVRARFRTPSLRRGLRRLQAFPEMGAGSPAPMGPQFLKLAVRWGVWPTIDTGPLIYPSRGRPTMSTALLKLLFDAECLRMGPEGELVANDDHLKRLAVRAEYEIAREVRRVLEAAQQSALVKLRDTQLGDTVGGIREWRVFELVDYFLWQLAKRRESIPSIPSVWTADDNRVAKE